MSVLRQVTQDPEHEVQVLVVVLRMDPARQDLQYVRFPSIQVPQLPEQGRQFPSEVREKPSIQTMQPLGRSWLQVLHPGSQAAAESPPW